MFSDRLKGIRTKSGLTQEEASKRLGIARTTYSGYERGTSEPDFNTLHKISEFFEVDLNWLITGELRDLNEEEKEIMKDFEKLSEKDKDFIIDLMKKLGR